MQPLFIEEDNARRKPFSWGSIDGVEKENSTKPRTVSSSMVQAAALRSGYTMLTTSSCGLSAHGQVVE